jgi:23S rRNA pseudouridine1911/1915/1917 synthase
MSDRRELPVPEGLDGLRVDAALARMFGLSRTAAAAVAEDGLVALDGVVRGKSDRVIGGSWMEVDLPERADAPAIPPPVAVEGMRLVFQDDHVVVIDKPPGVAAHPSPGWEGTTVVQGLAAAGITVATSGPAERAGIVHRLDVGTSGLMVVAKTEQAYSSLKRQFRERTVGKRYRTVVQGLLDPLRGTVDAPIDRHPGASFKFAVVAGGKPSVTHYETVEALRATSLVDIELETGRTHQIRVHMAALRHPVVGDVQYGADPTLAARLDLRRQWLHAGQLTFEHPATGDRVELSSENPPDLAAALATLRAESA